MSYPHPYHFGAPARATPPTNHRGIASPDQGAVHLSVNIHPHHAYHYATPANGFHAGQHYAGCGGTPQAYQYYTGSVPQAPYPRLSRKLQSLNAFDPALDQGMAGYGPVNASFVEPATHVNYYHNINPALRQPESLMRSSSPLSAVQYDDWDRESVEDSDSPGAGHVNSYSPPVIADRTAYATPEKSTPLIPLQLPGNSPPEAPASPAPAPAPQVMPAAAPTRSRRTQKRAGAHVPLTAANPNAVVRRKGAAARAAARAAASPTTSVTEPSSSASSAKCPRRAVPEASIAVEAGSTMAPAARSTTAPDIEPSAAAEVADGAAAERPPAPEGWVYCLWGGCGALLAKDVTVVSNHLRFVHFGELGRGACTCQWDEGCVRKMEVYSMVRHVTATHLPLQAHECLRCNKTFCREDSALRHQRVCFRCKSCGVQFDTRTEYEKHACLGRSAGRK